MSAKPTVYILGCYHQLQELPPSPPRPDGKKYLGALEGLLTPGEITFIGEEAGSEIPDSSARRLALKRKIEYADLDIPAEAKRLIRYVRQEHYVVNKEGTDSVLLDTHPQYRKAWGCVREFHMYTIFAELSAKHRVSLLICGIVHVKPFKTLLEDTHDVRAIIPVYDACKSLTEAYYQQFVC